MDVYTNEELLAAQKEMVQRYPNLYLNMDNTFAYWVSECQRYLDWKKDSDWDKVMGK